MNTLWRLVLAVSALGVLLGLGIYLTNHNNSLPLANEHGAVSTSNLAMPVSIATSDLPELRAVWVQARSVTSREKVDATLKRVETGHFNAIFVNVFVYGQALYQSDLIQKYNKIEAGFDPLAYLVEEAHRRKIEVYCWLVAGPVGGINGPILSQHPDWAMVSLDGETANWLNYNRPDVKQFISDLVLEIVTRYKVDGIHFDYTRYPHPGWKWGFDSYSAIAFAQVSGLDLKTLRYAELPAYGSFKGNPLEGVTTAEALAVFDDGQPAVLLNHYGAGEVLLFNWAANERTIAAGTTILQRGLDYLLGDNGDIYLLHSETNAEKYGYQDFERVLTWLEDLGRESNEVSEADIATLSPNSVLVMPDIYLIKAQTAADLADFVRRGGGLIFIDGPTPAIKDKNIQAITGMSSRGKYIDRVGLLRPIGKHFLVPSNGPELEMKTYQSRQAQWKAFRKQNIDKLLQDVYHRVKQVAPRTLVTITVAGNQTILADKHFLDWRAWLEGEYIDLIIPRVYIKQGESVEPALAEWQPVIKSSGRIIVGLSVFIAEESRQSKTPKQIVAEVALARASGSKGIILFDLEGLSDEVLERLAAGPFATQN